MVTLVTWLILVGLRCLGCLECPVLGHSGPCVPDVWNVSDDVLLIVLCIYDGKKVDFAIPTLESILNVGHN